MRLSIQLYTVRDLIKDDFSGTVQQLAKIGYRAVEMGGYGNLKSAKEARKALAKGREVKYARELQAVVDRAVEEIEAAKVAATAR